MIENSLNIVCYCLHGYIVQCNYYCVASIFQIWLVEKIFLLCTYQCIHHHQELFTLTVFYHSFQIKEKPGSFVSLSDGGMLGDLKHESLENHREYL